MTSLEQRIQNYLDDKFEFNTNIVKCKVILAELDEQKKEISVLVGAHSPGRVVGRKARDIIKIAKKIETEFQTYPRISVIRADRMELSE